MQRSLCIPKARDLVLQACHNKLPVDVIVCVSLTVNLVLSTELVMLISHREEIRKLTFRTLALRRSESRNCGLCVVYIQKYGATLLVGAWQREKQQNKLVE